MVSRVDSVLENGNGGGLLPWQSDEWAQLQQMLPRLPHALLIHGARGTGKTAFAERFAQALLCERPAAGGHPCNACPSCTWFAQYSHPDYRRVRPEVLDEDEGGADGDEAEASEVKKPGRAGRAPSKDIRIDQVRALGDFINMSTHRQGRRVILLYPADALNTASANSLLKMLEEPPPATVFLLVADSLDRLLPTILSRCRKFVMGSPRREQALQWLQAAGVADADALLAEQGGAPLAAQEMAHSELRAPIDEFLVHLATPDTEGALKTAERLAKIPLAPLVACLQRWLYDLFSLKISGRIRYYPQHEKQLAALVARCDVAGLARGMKAITDRRAIADHPLSARLFIEDMLLEYAALFAGQRRSK
ncbi:DNA polymerase III subunit delta' [Lacisediminimonas profundi]|uniref:DNA polymerase III subunit delta' n=1 Tax=Lacisediminimonas profundi TaxID=2603856 RepID=UPI00124B7414|nr:DNA polymerase III subunit delta' [Lacisediminimonas profundi]